MSEQFKAAFLRSLVVAFLSAASTALTTWATLPISMTWADGRTLIIATGTAFLAPFLVRWGGEGYYDTQRAKKGDVQSSDVKPLPRPRAA